MADRNALDPEEEALARLQRRELLAVLSPDDCGLWVALQQEGHTGREVARRLGVTHPAVHSRYRRALARLRARWKETNG